MTIGDVYKRQIQARFLLTLNGGGKLERDADARHLRDRLRLIFAVRINTVSYTHLRSLSEYAVHSHHAP